MPTLPELREKFKLQDLVVDVHIQDLFNPDDEDENSWLAAATDGAIAVTIAIGVVVISLPKVSHLVVVTGFVVVKVFAGRLVRVVAAVGDVVAAEGHVHAEAVAAGELGPAAAIVEVQLHPRTRDIPGLRPERRQRPSTTNCGGIAAVV